MLTKIQNVKINYISRILALPILTITVLAFTLRTKTISISSIKLDKPITIVIDAGHGIMENGKPNGVSVDGISEDNIVLGIAKRIEELNSNDNLKIILTRTSDKLVDLHKRVDVARENNASLFISLHVNAADPNQNPDLSSNQSLNKGFEIYVSGKEPVYQQQSELFGSALQQELKSVYSTNQYLLKRKVGVWVLDQNVCPSVLVECGFLTDEKDREFITKTVNQTAIAQKFLEAIQKYALNLQTQKIIGYIIPQSKTVISKDRNQSIENLDLKSNLQNTPLYILDGKEMSKAEVDKIDQATIASINVLKDKSAVEKYGSKAKNGAIEIKLKSHNPPLYILDGKEIIESDMKNLDPTTIESINILKDKSATDKYGKKGMNGVVEIKSKQQKTSSPITFQENGKTTATGRITVDPATKEIHGTFNTVGNQINDTVPKKEPLFTKVEIEASVNKEEWQQFLKKNLQPVIVNAASKGMPEGTYTVMVKFIVKKNGSISEIQALNNPGFGLAEQTVSFMKDSPKWKPGLQNGKSVNSYHTQPITFVIAEQ